MIQKHQTTKCTFCSFYMLATTNYKQTSAILYLYTKHLFTFFTITVLRTVSYHVSGYGSSLFQF